MQINRNAQGNRHRGKRLLYPAAPAAPFRDTNAMRQILSANALHPAIRDKVLSYHSDIVAEVQAEIAANRIVVVGMRYNGSVGRARKSLEAAGHAFKYLEYGSYTSGWRRRLALKMWTGWPTFPMIFVDGVFVGGNSDLQKLLAAKAL
ncbi:glutaredoxin [Marivivens sp. LCG002]|uniref:glutaredoxin n=1 Tax=Marivivens sp. LCG002 TaxID=3051171 RepID=UPI002555A0C8|nr:glutaredoxin [Marivivens sp. LCG002]WIV49732.1 glutaredoxin [Marivivens sp. LCG002]